MDIDYFALGRAVSHDMDAAFAKRHGYIPPVLTATEAQKETDMAKQAAAREPKWLDRIRTLEEQVARLLEAKALGGFVERRVERRRALLVDDRRIDCPDRRKC